MKRFYKKVSVNPVDGGWQVALDGRAMKTVKGAQQVVPSETLARALHAEWDEQGETIDPASMPLRDMTDYAIDIIGPDPAPAIDELVGYGDTDTLLYRADPDEPLYARQQKVWEPIVSAFEERHGIQFVRVSGIMHRDQNAATLDAMRAVLAQQDKFALAATQIMTNLAASLITGLSAAEPDASALDLWNAASLEEEWQAELWGRDEEAEVRRAKRAADFLKAREFWELSRS